MGSLFYLTDNYDSDSYKFAMDPSAFDELIENLDRDLKVHVPPPLVCVSPTLTPPVLGSGKSQPECLTPTVRFAILSATPGPAILDAAQSASAS